MGQTDLWEQRSLSKKWDHIPKSKPHGPHGTHGKNITYVKSIQILMKERDATFFAKTAKMKIALLEDCFAQRTHVSYLTFSLKVNKWIVFVWFVESLN